MRVGKVLKGKCPYDVIRINVGVGSNWHPKVLMRHLEVGAPGVIFYNKILAAEVYFNRFFFQLQGTPGTPPANAWWRFTHVEIKMNQTFCGTVGDLLKVFRASMEDGEPVPKPNGALPMMTAADLNALPLSGKKGDLPKSFGGAAKK